MPVIIFLITILKKLEFFAKRKIGIVCDISERCKMEIYLFAGLIVVYVVTVLLLKKEVLRKIWLAAFMMVFAISAAALSFLRFSHQEVMMNAEELSWYYILYLFASIMVVLGAINLWLFRRELIRVLFADSEENVS